MNTLNMVATTVALFIATYILAFFLIYGLLTVVTGRSCA